MPGVGFLLFLQILAHVSVAHSAIFLKDYDSKKKADGIISAVERSRKLK